MKKFEIKSVRARLTIWFLILTLIPLLGVLFIIYQQQVSIIEESTFDKLTVIRDLKIIHLNNWFNEREGDVKTISEDDELTSLEDVFRNNLSQEEKNSILKNSLGILNRYLKNYSVYEEIYVINAQTGIIEISSDKNNIGKNKSSNIYFTKVLETKSLYFQDIYFDKDDGNEIHMAYSMPIFSSKGNTSHIIGVLVARIDLYNSLFKTLLNRTSLGETGETLIVNKDGVALNELRWHNDAPLKLHIKAEPAIKASQGNTGIVITEDYRGEKVLAAYTYIPKMGWGFVSKQDLNELYAPIREMIINFLLLFIVVSMVILLIAFSISKSISKPIVSINSVTKKIKEGDYTVRNVVETNDEFGSLAVSINKMAQSIESRISIDEGVAFISETIIGKSSILKFSTDLLQQLMKITKADMSTFYILNEEIATYDHLTSIGANEELLRSFSVKNPEGEFGNVFIDKRIYYLQDIPENTIFKFKTTVGDIVPKEIITIPIVVDGKVEAIISLINIAKFSSESYEALTKSWQAINIAYSNLLANEQTKTLAENLALFNQRLEVQSEELQQTSDELKEQNIELELQKKQLDEASRLKTTFLSNMSHELRTPLNSVIALSGVLNRKLVSKIPKEEYSYLDVIERNGKHLLSLINNILDISRIESGREEIEITKFNVNNLVTELITMLKPQAMQKNIQLIQENSNGELLISSDVSKCKHILQNLIGNAVKFTDTGKVEVIIKKIKNTIVINIIDTGIGIPKNMLSHVFDEFRQVDGSTSRRFEGTGLGLAIAKKYADLLGGEISVKSTSGKGSEFTLSLPLFYAGDQTGEVLETTHFKQSKTLAHESATNNPSSKTILVVEDSEPAIIQVKDILEEIGYQILVARDGSEALKMIHNTIPDGIILDLMMPRVDGFEVLKTLREDKLTELVPVLILTAKQITKKELKFLKSNNIHQLIQKGDIKRYELVHSITSMVFPFIENKVQPKLVKSPIDGKPLVLVVEDNEDNMITLKALLADNYTVIEATDGKKGVSLAKKHKPHIILMDIALPKMDGFEAFKTIRKLPTLKHIPIIAVTASALTEDREKILAFGFDAYIAKPIDEDIFYNTIKQLLYEK
jgi:signal transduction histidine kinase/CheY-like chemotaxis protein/HAMP domain-containing protein